MAFRSVTVAAIAAVLGVQGCGSGAGRPASPKPAAKLPEMTLQLYDGIGGGVRAAANEPTNDCEQRSPNLGVPSSNPNQEQICTLAPRPISDAVTNPDCPCGAECLVPWFDHNKNRGPEGTVQMYTPPASRRYYPGVPSAKHWEVGVTQNIFTYDVELTNFYDRDLENVFIVLVEVSPDDGREGFEDARPHACLKNDYAVWSFGDIKKGEKVKRTLKLLLPNDEGFTVTGFVVSLSGAACLDELQDADGDNLDDAAELAGGTDPNDPDTDGDGLFDGAESETGQYVHWWDTGTDPLLRDTDGDCFGDGAEVAEGFDPNDDGSAPARKCNPADLKNPVP